MINLTEVSLKNRSLVWYFIIVTIIAGVFSYVKLGRMEDPSFTIRQMVVTAAWPGATAQQMDQQVTDKLESKFRDIPGVKSCESVTRAGTSVVYVQLRDDVDSSTIRNTWRDVRNFAQDVSKDLPTGVYGPYCDDRFDDVYGSVYAITGDGFTMEEMRQEAEKLRRLIASNVKNVQKVKLLGEQTEKVYVEIENAKLAELKISPMALADALKTQNEITPAGMIETSTDNVYLRYSGTFDDVEAIKNTPIEAGGKVFRLGDIAKVERRTVEPSDTAMYFNGERAIGLAVSMEKGGNIITMGDSLHQLIEKAQQDLPAGMEIQRVSDQPAVVESSIAEFISTLREAIIIVLAVSFLSLGVRTGMVVACCIPLVLAAVFVGMYILGIDLQKVSLGSLIIALGLLVDDAIIAVEMMSVQLERGHSRFDAACYAFKATAKPMLTGTLITCAGFIPVAFSKGMAAEFCSALFPVISMALIISWIISVMVAPLFGYYLIKVKPQGEGEDADPYGSKFYVLFKKVLNWFLEHRKMVLSGTVALFAVSLLLMTQIKEEFFPPSVRPEILISMELPEGASKQAAGDASSKFAEFLNNNSEEIENYSYYVGEGAPRFVLTVDPELPRDNYAQFVVVAKDAEQRDALQEKIYQELEDNYPEVRYNIKVLQTGPPADYPVMLRVSGYDIDKVKSIANQVADRVATDDNNKDVSLDWYEKSKVLHLEFDQAKLRSMGLSAQAVAKTVYTEISGATAAQFYTGDRTIDIQLRLSDVDRSDLSKIKNIPIYSAGGFVPLEQLAKVSFAAEDGVIKRYAMLPSIMVQANIKNGTANDATAKAYADVQDIIDKLPAGYSIEPEGALADSQDSMGYLMAPIPAMVFVIMTLLMFQLRRGKDVLITLLTAPLGIIGVAFGMLLLDKAMGFVAILGVLALSGMIIRNSVILIDQIQKHINAGEAPWDAVVDSAVLRFRPIMLTAAAAILGMLPLMFSIFWGPMAVAIASGLIVATVLILLVLPVMYVTIYKIKRSVS
ncbi:MAG: efflux RND transporter permease subunit [Selenomonadaceae bacterium]|nr:efflux RND transporter permease subunit [Selenomonadaceae bacterium]